MDQRGFGDVKSHLVSRAGNGYLGPALSRQNGDVTIGSIGLVYLHLKSQ